MLRIPEPELMEDEEQARVYAETDFEQTHRFAVELLGSSIPDLPSTGIALDLGCGPADITLRFAKAFPGWRVDGVDGSEAMLSHGRLALQREGLGDRIHLVRQTLPSGEGLRQQYDLVFSTSLLHHLGEPEVLWASVKRWAPAGTPVFVMDLMRPASRELAEQLVDTHYPDGPDVLRRDFLSSLIAAYRVDEVREQLSKAELSHFQVEAATDRHLVSWGRR
jgi:cyclopropane fatty-acyl-phospholipid synthase-like methyltransferase